MWIDLFHVSSKEKGAYLHQLIPCGLLYLRYHRKDNTGASSSRQYQQPEYNSKQRNLFSNGIRVDAKQ